MVNQTDEMPEDDLARFIDQAIIQRNRRFYESNDSRFSATSQYNQWHYVFRSERIERMDGSYFHLTLQIYELPENPLDLSVLRYTVSSTSPQGLLLEARMFCGNPYPTKVEPIYYDSIW